MSCTLGLWQDPALQVSARAAPPAIAQRTPQRNLPGLVVARPRGKARLDSSVPLLLTATLGRLLRVRPRSERAGKPMGLQGRAGPLRRSLPRRRPLPHSRRVVRQGVRRQWRNGAALCCIHLADHHNNRPQSYTASRLLLIKDRCNLLHGHLAQFGHAKVVQPHTLCALLLASLVSPRVVPLLEHGVGPC